MLHCTVQLDVSDTTLLLQGGKKPQQEINKTLWDLSQRCNINEAAKHIIQQLKLATYALTARRGEASISPDVVDYVFQMYADEVVTPRHAYMQQLVRQLHGKQLGVDHTYAAVSSLAGAAEYAHNSLGRKKTASFAASLLTATVGGPLAGPLVIMSRTRTSGPDVPRK